MRALQLSENLSEGHNLYCKCNGILWNTNHYIPAHYPKTDKKKVKVDIFFSKMRRIWMLYILRSWALGEYLELETPRRDPYITLNCLSWQSPTQGSPFIDRSNSGDWREKGGWG